MTENKLGTYIGLDQAHRLAFLLVQLIKLEHLFIREHNQLAIGFDTARGDTLWQGYNTSLCSPRDDHLSWVGFVRLGDRLNAFVLQDRSSR